MFGGRFPVYLSNYLFDNKEGGVETGGNDLGKWPLEFQSYNDDFETIEDSFRQSILKLQKQGNFIILVYPIPEIGWVVPYKLLEYVKSTDSTKKINFKKIYVSTSYELFVERTKNTFRLFDSIKGKKIYRVYPHKLFCNTLLANRCIGHDYQNIFYSDAHHPSLKGAELINDLILKEVRKFKN